MTFKPRHFAAVQYTVIALFLIAVWHTMLTPIEQSSEQLKYMFQEEPTKTFSICLAIATIGAIFLSASFWIRQAEKKRHSLLLAIVSASFFGLAIWQFSQSLIIGFGLACALAISNWRSSNSKFDTDASHRST